MPVVVEPAVIDFEVGQPVEARADTPGWRRPTSASGLPVRSVVTGEEDHGGGKPMVGGTHVVADVRNGSDGGTAVSHLRSTSPTSRRAQAA